MASKDFNVRIGQDEISHILDRKENLDHHGQLWEYLSRYQALGWDLTLVTAQGADLDLDLKQPQKACWKQLADLGLEGVQVNLAARTGCNSRLLVLEVNKGAGTLSLDLLGDWRAHCVAELNHCREQHYYYLPPGTQAPSSHFLAQDVLIYGEGGLVLTPPSIEPEGRDPWRWLTSPWDNPPQAPKPAVWQFLREQNSPAVPGLWAGAGATPGGPIPESLAAGLLASLEQILGVGELPRQLLGEGDPELSQPKFEKNVYGQFFQLLAILGDRVISESCRNEAVYAGMGAQATELERLVTEIEPLYAPPAAGGGDAKSAPPSADRGAALPLWGAAMARQPSQKTRKLQEVKAMVQDFLSQNPDLAEDRGKVQMVLFCLKNYVSINPDYAGLSFREKLEKAGEMARTFLNLPDKPQ